MGAVAGLLHKDGIFDDIIDLIIILVVLQFLCCAVMSN